MTAQARHCFILSCFCPFFLFGMLTAFLVYIQAPISYVVASSIASGLGLITCVSFAIKIAYRSLSNRICPINESSNLLEKSDPLTPDMDAMEKGHPREFRRSSSPLPIPQRLSDKVNTQIPPGSYRKYRINEYMHRFIVFARGTSRTRAVSENSATAENIPLMPFRTSRIHSKSESAVIDIDGPSDCEEVDKLHILNSPISTSLDIERGFGRILEKENKLD